MVARAFKNIRSYLQPGIFFIPFTYYFFLFVIAVILGNLWLWQKNDAAGSSFNDVFLLLLKAGFWFLIAIIGFAFLSVAVSFIIFLFKKKNKSVRFAMQSSEPPVRSAVREKYSRKIHIEVSPLFKPLLGFIKLRLQYDNSRYSEKFLLVEEKTRSLVSSKYAGDFEWTLPEIREYHIKRLILYFEDIFQFFSFTVAIPAASRFITHPFTPQMKEISLSPRRTEDTLSRIEELKKVEGEYLNYKNFENNDDVRRIVWKIYAKNKELVVRMPEVLDPYASHAYVYASFYNSFSIIGNSTAEILFLNYYKTVLWGVYQKLEEQGFAMRFFVDQPAESSFAGEGQPVKYAISTADWQAEKDIKTFVNFKDASLIIFSSLCDVHEIENILAQANSGTVWMFVKLSSSLENSYLISMLKWIFVKQEKNEIEVYKANWRFSAIRSKIMHNEKQLDGLLQKYNKTAIV